jgi:hypothetical protein
MKIMGLDVKWLVVYEFYLDPGGEMKFLWNLGVKLLNWKLILNLIQNQGLKMSFGKAEGVICNFSKE